MQMKSAQFPQQQEPKILNTAPVARQEAGPMAAATPIPDDDEISGHAPLSAHTGAICSCGLDADDGHQH